MSTQSTGASSPQTIQLLPTLGLSRLRQRNGVSLEQIADQTKISMRFLRAIESEDFDQLPGGLFATSYIRQYAATAGLDETDILAQFKEKTSPQEEAPIPRKTPAWETKNWFGRWLGIAANAPR
jgi:transcriptional regulator with XRE-family HTH domain